MADRLVVMSGGKVRQIGSQRELYEAPADRFVAGFIGRSAFLEGRVTAPGIFTTDGGLAVRCPAATAQGPAGLALRPERIAAGAEAASCDNRFTAKVEYVSYLGSLLDVHVRLSEHDRLVLQLANRQGMAEPKVGDTIEIGWNAPAGMVFPAENEN